MKTRKLIGLATLILVLLSCNFITQSGDGGESGETTSVPTMIPLSSDEAPPTLVPSPGPTDTPPALPPDVIFEGVSFSFDDALASWVEPEIVPATDPEVESWWQEPEHIRFNFRGYILADTFHEPQLLVYPAVEYAATDEIVKETMDQMRTLLAERPVIPPGNTLPFLPIFNAGQETTVKAAYLQFANGSGLRYLTQYSQSGSPINNYELFYTFQGLTTDQQYYVIAILPVTHPSLPRDNSHITDWAEFSDNFQEYIVELTGQLSIQDDASFSPSLILLDEMLQSLQVH
jgi:hypothetical protein